MPFLRKKKKLNNSKVIDTHKKKPATHMAIIPDEFSKYEAQQEKKHPHLGTIGKLKKKFEIMGTSKDLDTQDTSQFSNSMLKLLGYKALTPDRHQYLELVNNHQAPIGFAEILQIGGSSLYDLPPTAVERVLMNFINFLRAFLPDMTFVSIHLPNDSRPQKRFWLKVRHGINLKLYYYNNISYHRRQQLLAQRGFIDEALTDFKSLDKNMNNQAFVLMIFGATEKELETNVHRAFQFGAKALKLSLMSEHQKEVFLTRLNNPSNNA